MELFCIVTASWWSAVQTDGTGVTQLSSERITGVIMNTGSRGGRTKTDYVHPVAYAALTCCNMQCAFGKALCTFKRWCSRASIQTWSSLILFANAFRRSAFGKSLCTYKWYWKWFQWASVQTWGRLILLSNTFCWSTFGNSLCTYKSVGSDVHERQHKPEPVPYRSSSAQRLYERKVQKPARQCTYKVIWRRVRLDTFAVENY
jgi:hypothetical protein